VGAIRFVLGDQLDHDLSALRDLDLKEDIVLLAEVRAETTSVPHHRQKIILILSAMRHFADELRARGAQVRYFHLDDPEPMASFTEALSCCVRESSPDRIVMTHPGEWRVLLEIQTWAEQFRIPVEVRADDRFLCPLETFASWANDRRSLRMEYFYRDMRRRTGWLMEGSEPCGGRWNFDEDNRKPWPRDRQPPERLRFVPDATTQAVMTLTQQQFGHHFGDADGFAWAVTRKQALLALDDFIARGLPEFGAFQDAMVADADFLHHALLSPYLNIGLLRPREVCIAAMDAYASARAPLSSVEGFVRQILGWREFVRGIYWWKMPAYAESNYLGATRPLPDLYWTGDTDMRCMRQVIASTRRNAYAHHIQRLMVTGNFALLAGISPAEVERWYLSVYADAFEWVELPNTHGMALHADGGVLGSKPYAASGAYIHRMSNYCGGCRYSPKEKFGENACPFNFLYWDFMRRNADRLAANPRMAMPYRNLARLTSEQQERLSKQAQEFLDSL
jgi:deoxyribodipyrimidine photolyase-related protein